MGNLVVAAGAGAGQAKRSRRRWTVEEKLAIVAAAKTSGDPVAVVARRHGMNANHLFEWLRRDRDGTLDRRTLYRAPGGPLDFVELGVVGERPLCGPSAPAMEIDLPCGAKVRIGAGVDAAMLGTILAAVRAAS
jgi:hypothetical protein